MTSAVICDGCHGVVQGEPTKLGHIIQNDYCEKCAPLAQDYLDSIDRLHDMVAEKYEIGSVDIKNVYRKKLKSIPDEQSDQM